ncbi:MAG: sugar nucleotide-binding protein, partial [Albidovulum sp.]|uniref:sugar nucleotide-binding protein n=1 Tax=Albidovulum sp. TaxID=1872424 RepID=UPI003C7FC204
AGIDCAVADITSAEYAAMLATPPAFRPANSRMDNTSFQTAFGLPRPDWRAGLRDILKDLGEI